jgi:hypothetical protein
MHKRKERKPIDLVFLKDNFQTMTNKELAEKFGVGSAKVATELKKLGLKRKKLNFEPMEDEQLVSLPLSYGDYSVSNKGRVINTKTNTLLKPYVNNHGYSTVTLYGETEKKYLVHRLVLLAFDPIADSEKLQVNHLNGNKKDNSFLNLEWVSHQENIDHAIKNNLFKIGEEHPNSIYSVELVESVCRLLEKRKSNIEITRLLNLKDTGLVESIKYKNTWLHVSKNYDF